MIKNTDRPALFVDVISPEFQGIFAAAYEAWADALAESDWAGRAEVAATGETLFLELLRVMQLEQPDSGPVQRTTATGQLQKDECSQFLWGAHLAEAIRQGLPRVGALSERMQIVSQAFEQARQTGRRSPTWSELDRLTSWKD